MATRRKGSSNNGRSTQQRAQDERDRLAEQLSERADQLAGHAEDLADRAQHMAMQADRRVRGAVDRRPMTAIWTSFGVGLGLGLAVVALMPRDRRSGWSLDDLSGSLRHLGERVEAMGRSATRQASGYAHDLGDRASGYAHDLGDSASRRAKDAAGLLGF
ncbi:hypothetical protein [Tautonia plasticadhaerens]|uniref:YtxH-like protein n=1 Tax=Tautonia plasticadhaerens TaxID=2527974 RepID=A0A518HDR9_9BACT|nr:hypothetical protein [Tautonia plasticadhaerens]QDV39007.1 hypothetical protein ElP_69680 [Tautonia plasticadhaerens]